MKREEKKNSWWFFFSFNLVSLVWCGGDAWLHEELQWGLLGTLAENVGLFDAPIPSIETSLFIYTYIYMDRPLRRFLLAQNNYPGSHPFSLFLLSQIIPLLQPHPDSQTTRKSKRKHGFLDSCCPIDEQLARIQQKRSRKAELCKRIKLRVGNVVGRVGANQGRVDVLEAVEARWEPAVHRFFRSAELLHGLIGFCSVADDRVDEGESALLIWWLGCEHDENVIWLGNEKYLRREGSMGVNPLRSVGAAATWWFTNHRDFAISYMRLLEQGDLKDAEIMVTSRKACVFGLYRVKRCHPTVRIKIQKQLHLRGFMVCRLANCKRCTSRPLVPRLDYIPI